MIFLYSQLFHPNGMLNKVQNFIIIFWLLKFSIVSFIKLVKASFFVIE